nr:MAG TPA: hypothetical protein [Caudoviricetes sp.]
MNIPFWVYGKFNSYYRQQTKAEFLLSHGFISNHRFEELGLVAQYLYSLDSSIGLPVPSSPVPSSNKDETVCKSEKSDLHYEDETPCNFEKSKLHKKELLAYCRKWFKDFNEVKYNPIINTIVQSCKKRVTPLVEIPSVSLPMESCEIMFDMVNKLNVSNNKKAAITKLLFALAGLTLLEKKRTNKSVPSSTEDETVCSFEKSKLHQETDTIYINHKYTDIQKTAGISSANKLIELLQILATPVSSSDNSEKSEMRNNIIDVSINGAISLTQAFVWDIKLFKKSENTLTILDYDHLYKYSTIAFDMLHDRVPIYKPCALCNTLFTANRNVHKYCDRCSKLVKNYQNLQYYKNKKEGLKK